MIKVIPAKHEEEEFVVIKDKQDQMKYQSDL